MAKDCDCALEADKVVNKPKYTFNSFIRLLVLTVLALTAYNAVAYYVLPDKFHIPLFITLSNVLIGMLCCLLLHISLQNG